MEEGITVHAGNVHEIFSNAMKILKNRKDQQILMPLGGYKQILKMHGYTDKQIKNILKEMI